MSGSDTHYNSNVNNGGYTDYQNGQNQGGNQQQYSNGNEPGGSTHTVTSTVDNNHGGTSFTTIFLVGIPLLACGMFIYFAMKKVFKSIEEAEGEKSQQLNQGLMSDAPGFKQTMVTSDVRKEARCLKGKHIMPLVDTSPDGLQWHCDICQYTYAAKPGWLFYSCTKCDQDFCPNCFGRVERTIVQERVDTLAVQQQSVSVRNQTVSARGAKPVVNKKNTMKEERKQRFEDQDVVPGAPQPAIMNSAKPNLKAKASKALEQAKNDPRVQKAGQQISAKAKKAGESAAVQQINSKVNSLGAKIKSKVNEKLNQNDQSGIPEVAVYNINETAAGSLASSQAITPAPKRGSARERRQANNMTNQYKPNPGGVNQHLPEDQSMTAAFMRNQQKQQEGKNMADNRSDYSDDMEKERAPTYSNLYDAKVRAASEYVDPYGVSRSGTVAGQLTPAQNAQQSIPQHLLQEGSQYQHQDPNWQQNQQSVQGQDQYSLASHAQADDHYQQTRGTESGYDATFHQAGNDNAGYGETFHQPGNQNQGQPQYGQRNSLYDSHHEGYGYNEADYDRARDGGTVADLSEYLAQKRQEDVDAGYDGNQNNRSFGQDETHEVYPQMSESVAQDVDDYHGQYNQESHQQNQQSYQDNQQSYQQNQESYQQQDGQEHYDQNQQYYDQNQQSYQEHHDGQEGYDENYHQNSGGTFADLNDYLADNTQSTKQSVKPGDQEYEEDNEPKMRTNTQIDLENFLNQK